jgi:Terminase small subunit
LGILLEVVARNQNSRRGQAGQAAEKSAPLATPGAGRFALGRAGVSLRVAYARILFWPLHGTSRLGAGKATCGKTEMARPKGTPKATCPKSTLRPRPAAFVREYLAAGWKNAKQAAIRAGYAGGPSAEVSASRLLHDPKVAAEIEKVQGRVLRRHELSADRVLRATTNIAFFDPGELFDKTASGRLIYMADRDIDLSTLL